MRRSRRSRTAGAVVVMLALVVASAGTAVAEDEPPAPEPPATTVPPTTVPATPPTTGGSEPPPPTAPPAVPTIPDDPHGERSALSPAETLAAEAEYSTLTDGQRGLLRQLQSAKEAVAARRFGLLALAREVATAREALDAARAVEGEARARVEETSAQIQRLRDEIVRLAAAAYRNHTGSFAIGAVGAVDTGSASTLARAQVYARADAAFLGTRVDSLVELRRRLDTERRAAEAARLAAEASANDLDARLVAQQEAYAEAEKATARAQAAALRGLGADMSLVAQMIAPRAGADQIGATLAFVQSGQPDPPTMDAIFLLPVPGASLSSPYGLRIDPVAGTVAFHAGLDFGVAARTPIRAAAAGMVVIAGDCGGYGNCVVIDHGWSLGTLYGHQSQVDVRVGEVVQAGQVIGLVGSTGKSTGPHLHFEVRHRGVPVDPVPTLGV